MCLEKNLYGQSLYPITGQLASHVQVHRASNQYLFAQLLKSSEKAEDYLTFDESF